MKKLFMKYLIKPLHASIRNPASCITGEGHGLDTERPYSVRRTLNTGSMRFFEAFLVWLILLLPGQALATPRVQHWLTDNGARVYFIETHDLPMVDVRLVFDAAAARDPAGRNGLAMLTNDMLLEGSGELDTKEIAEGFENRGAEISTSSLRDMAIVSLRTLSDDKYLDPVMELLARIVSRPSFPKDNLERERARALQALDHALQNPGTVAKRKLFTQLYGDHPYANFSIGTREGLQAITRKDLLDFHQRYYVAANLVIALVGDLDAKQARALANSLSSPLARGRRAGALPPVKDSQASETRIDFPSTQSHILMAHIGVRRSDPRNFALKLGNHALGGGGFQSRLMDEIREKRGLSYGAYSYFLPMQERGPFIASLQTRNDQVGKALEVMRNVIRDYLARGPTPQEVEMAKKNITGGFPLTIDSNKKMVGTLAMMGFYGLPLDYLDTYIDRINAVTREQITKAMQSTLNMDGMHTVIVGGEK